MNRKHLILLTITLVILSICICLFHNKSYKNITIEKDEKSHKNITIEKDDICIGTMHYSYRLGFDAGTEYIVSIYYNNENIYKYEVTEGDVTEEGYTENKKVNGMINSKYDLIELDKKYKSKKSDGFDESDIEYKVKNKEPVKNINDFIEEVFNYKDEKIK